MFSRWKNRQRVTVQRLPRLHAPSERRDGLFGVGALSDFFFFTPSELDTVHRVEEMLMSHLDDFVIAVLIYEFMK